VGSIGVAAEEAVAEGAADADGAGAAAAEADEAVGAGPLDALTGELALKSLESAAAAAEPAAAEEEEEEEAFLASACISCSRLRTGAKYGCAIASLAVSRFW
jgi:hypothetical protein